MSKNNWYIRSFDDYHDIESETFNTFELGCFPEPNFGYCRYFGLFYKGKRPPRKQVIGRLLKRVFVGKINNERTGTDISVTKEEVISEVPKW